MPDSKRRHFGVHAVAGVGHLNPLMALSQELAERGHEITFFGKPKIEPDVRRAGFGFIPLYAKTSPARQASSGPITTIRSEIATLRYRLALMRAELESDLAESPALIARAGVNALLVDEIALAGPTVAQLLDLPYILIATSVPHHLGWNFFSWFSGFRVSKTWLSWLEALVLEHSVLRIGAPVRRTLDHFRRAAGLGPTGRIAEEYPPRMHITQLPPCMNPDRRLGKPRVEYAGPFVNHFARPCVPFLWHRLDSRPLVYASLGTTGNVQPAILRMIAEACCNLQVQLVISLGNRLELSEITELSGNPIVVRYAPQLELLARATVAITHGGSNTVFETLLEGKPMVVIPLAYDQPAMAARLKRLGVARVLPVMHLSPKRIRRALVSVLENATYRNAAKRAQAELRAHSGATRAAKMIEESLENCAPGKEAPASSEQRPLPWGFNLECSARSASSCQRVKKPNGIL